MIRKYFKNFLFAALIILVTPFSAAASEYKITIDGKELAVTAKPAVINGHTMLPLRQVFESLGYAVFWESERNIITATDASSTILMKIDSDSAYIDNVYFKLDVPPTIANGSALISAQFITEAAGVNIDVKNGTEISITTPEYFQNMSSNNIFSFSQLEETVSQPVDYEELKKSVVMINTDIMQGSGVVIGEGLIATNFHVIDNAETLKITFWDGSVYDGNVSVAGFNYDLDFAVLRIGKVGMQTAKIGNSDTLKRGDDVIVIGSPLGNFNTVTEGVFMGQNAGVIYATALIQQGTSGGAMFNSNGRLVGIAFAYDNAKRNFALPINLFLAETQLDLNFSLSDLKNFKHRLSYPKYITSAAENGSFNISWNPMYNAEGYYVFICDEKDGHYVAMDNPNTGGKIWAWGYPNSLSVNASAGVKKYVRISAIRNGAVSELSPPLELSF